MRENADQKTSEYGHFSRSVNDPLAYSQGSYPFRDIENFDKLKTNILDTAIIYLIETKKIDVQLLLFILDVMALVNVNYF